MAIKQGLFTGLMGYQLRKDFLGDALFYREVEVYNFEIYSVDLIAMSPTTIQNNMYQTFSAYTGNVYVKSLQSQGEYTFPSDGRRAYKFNVEVQVMHEPTTISSSQSELSTNLYAGLDYTFFTNYGTALADFKEEYGFAQNDNGNRTFNHNLSFGLLTGGRPLATQIAAYSFARDDNIPYGAGVLSGIGCLIFNSGNYQNYYTETYDIAKNTFSFNRRRELLPLSGALSVYDLIHTLDMKDDGIFDVSEKCTLQGNISFNQSQTDSLTQYSLSYTRCNNFFNIYKNQLNYINVTNPLISAPVKTLTNYNKNSLLTDYEVTFTNNPFFKSDGTSIEETIFFEADKKGVVDIKHTFDFSFNKRNPPTNGFMTMINNAYVATSGTASNYYLNSNFYTAAWPLVQIKNNLNYPNRKPKTTAAFTYSNHPKYTQSYNGVNFNYLTWTVDDTKPVDIFTENKIINRPSQTSVVSYAYQTEKGTLAVNLEAGIGRIANEFTNTFRTNLQPYLQAMYLLGGQVFLNEFNGVLPINFTYFLEDIKYSLNSDGIVQLNLVFNYTIKKYYI